LKKRFLTEKKIYIYIRIKKKRKVRGKYVDDHIRCIEREEK